MNCYYICAIGLLVLSNGTLLCDAGNLFVSNEPILPDIGILFLSNGPLLREDDLFLLLNGLYILFKCHFIRIISLCTQNLRFFFKRIIIDISASKA